MKKLLLIMLLTFTTMASADEGRYSMIAAGEFNHIIWVLDTEKGKLRSCWRAGEYNMKIYCNKEDWKDLNDDDD